LNFKYVNPYAASAAFGLASTGHEIRAMSSSGYGSIGTVMMHWTSPIMMKNLV
jgi:ClpP class serine protease